MKTIIFVRTKGDETTLPGGIVLSKTTHGYAVHYFNTPERDHDERPNGNNRHQGSYPTKLSDALDDFARRVAGAEGYDAGGALVDGTIETPTGE